MARITGLYDFYEFKRHYSRRLGLAATLEQTMRPVQGLAGEQILDGCVLSQSNESV
jgi:hypothetical protein